MSEYLEWKNKQKKNLDGILEISLDKKFTHNEDEYETNIDFSSERHGYGIIKLINHLKCDTSGPGLEIGSGNGLLSVSLSESHPFPDLLITDSSLAFVKLCRDNINIFATNPKNITYGVLNGDDINTLPENEFSLICMTNALHHIENFKEFISKIEKKIKKRGAFILQEPISDGFLMLGLIIKSYIKFSKIKDKKKLQILEELSMTMSNSNRRDINKAHLEDKHIFNIYELQEISSDLNLKFHAYPNVSLNTFSSGVGNIKDQQESFSSLAKGYLTYCLNWDESFKKELIYDINDLLLYIDEACTLAYYPPISGVFCMLK